MSRYMLCDDATINDINPFVVHDFSLPGGVRQTPEFANHTTDVGAKKQGSITYENLSPICDVAKTSGDRTVDFCTGGREPACPLGRPVHPRRNIDYGFTRDVVAAAARVSEKLSSPLAVNATNGIGFLIFIILVALVVSVLRR